MIEARAVDRRLHGLVTAAARNPHLTSLGAHLTAAATLGFGAEPYAPEFLAQARAEHEELVEHIAARRRRRGRPVRRRSTSRSRSSRCGPSLRKARDARPRLTSRRRSLSRVRLMGKTGKPRCTSHRMGPLFRLPLSGCTPALHS